MPETRPHLADIFSDMLSDISLDLDSQRDIAMLADIADILGSISLDLDGHSPLAGDLGTDTPGKQVNIVELIGGLEAEVPDTLDFELPADLC